jgi:hypothetical protein
MYTVVYQLDHQTVVSDGTVNRWWSCHWYYSVLYLASSILHISMLCLTLIVCCMCCSLCWCSFCNTHSDNRHSGFLHDHLELLYHRQNRGILGWPVSVSFWVTIGGIQFNKCTQIYQIVSASCEGLAWQLSNVFSCVYKYAWVDKFYFCWCWEIEGLNLFDVDWLIDHVLIVKYYCIGASRE